jgi:hypothetical protein
VGKPHHVPAKVITADRNQCPIWPSKVRYSVRTGANKALTHARERFGSDHAVNVYKCKGCGGFHLTKQRESQRAEQRRQFAS